jgi:hypothetical protein
MKLHLEIMTVNGFYCTATKQFDAIFGKDSDCCGLRAPGMQKVVCGGDFRTHSADRGADFFHVGVRRSCAPNDIFVKPRDVSLRWAQAAFAAIWSSV